MALIHSFESSGNFLFRYRGQIPVVLFLAAIPVIYLTDYKCLDNTYYLILILFSSSISFIGLLIRSIAIGTSNKHTSGRNTKEQVAEALNTTGIYSTMRHPLYVGNYFMWIGIVIYTMNFWFFLITSLAFWLYYERIMFAEERFLERKFGQQYLDWSLKVPAFIPSWKNYVKNTIPFSFKTILRREYSGVTATMLGFLFIDVLRNAFEKNQIEYQNSYGITLIIAISISIVFRTLKHNTKLLYEANRS